MIIEIRTRLIIRKLNLACKDVAESIASSSAKYVDLYLL